jgi:hypothetical protein
MSSLYRAGLLFHCVHLWLAYCGVIHSLKAITSVKVFGFKTTFWVLRVRIHFRIRVSPELFLPGQNISSVLESQLVPLDIRGTEKFYVDGHPELFVRRDINLPPKTVQESDRGYVNLRLQGVDVLPYAVVHNSEGLYVVTYKVDGQPLENMLQPGQDDRFINDVDRLYAQLGRFLFGAWQDGKPTAVDVFGPQQYMYGTVKNQRRGIKFVDIDMRSGRILNFPGELTEEAINIANDIVTAEAGLERPAVLIAARNMVRHLFAVDLESSGVDPLTIALGNLGNMVLESGVSTFDHINDTQEEIIDKYGSI